MSNESSTRLPVIKIADNEEIATIDALAIEEPLEIRLAYGEVDQRKVQNISVTMRTPGNDTDLALGFLFTEGIIKQQDDVNSVDYCFIACADNKENVIQVSIKEGIEPELHHSERNFYTTSSCGVCGKTAISSIKTVSTYNNSTAENQVSADLLHQLPIIVKRHQQIFADTGGLHASALFTLDGELLLVREDVGRHNALDKLIGAALNKNWLPLDQYILLLSGRISFELVQKAAMAGIGIVAAVGAPSSLAVQLAEEFDITLVGFLRDQRFNIYNQPKRILLSKYENSY